jgi:2,3,4,5-tetrahydropyridine-2,6-dicarboxylate N-succinyltransferase
MLKISLQELEDVINQAWLERKDLKNNIKATEAIKKVLHDLDNGILRVATKQHNSWHIYEWIKKAILLSFAVIDNQLINSGQINLAQQSNWYDKIPSKFLNWDEEKFKQAGFRVVPGCIARYSSYVAKGAVLMPSFLNVGCYIGENTMIDTWASVNSCAQIGKNCHISAGVVIGGVLEPLQANPVIVEDHCFIGAGSIVSEGVLIEEGSVIASGVVLNASTKIYDSQTKEITYGKIPPYAVVVPGALPSSNISDNVMLTAAIIIKKVDAKTRNKTSINDILRI